MGQIDELMSVWEQRREQGELLSPEILCAQHPELLNEVRWQIKALNAFESQFANSGSANPNTSLNSPPQRDQQRFQIASEYQILTHHASGGLGDVYLARESILNRRVAIKFPRAQRLNSEQLARFEREARITGRLDHPGIVAVHALKSDDSQVPCYVMRFVEGPTLHERAVRWHQQFPNKSKIQYASLEFRELLQHFVALCNIVAYAHQQHVVHRDIKPANVILGNYGETFLMDWGLARVDSPVNLSTLTTHRNSTDVGSAPQSKEIVAIQSSLRDPSQASAQSQTDSQSQFSPQSQLGSNIPDGNTALQFDTDKTIKENQADDSFVSLITKSGQFVGTPAFAAPEQLLGNLSQVNESADIYSLGATLYFILCGSLPISEPGGAVHLASLTSGVLKINPLPVAVPPPLQAVCRHALQFQPSDRYPNALTFAADLQRYLADEPVSILVESWTTRSFRWLRKHRSFTLTAATSLVFLTIFATAALAWISSLNRDLAGANLKLISSNDELVKTQANEQLERQRAEDNYQAAREAVQQYLVNIDGNDKLVQTDFSDLRRELLVSAKPFLERLRNQNSDDPKIELSRIEAAFRLALIDQQTGEPDAAEAGYRDCLAIINAARERQPDNTELIYHLARSQRNLAMIVGRRGERELAEKLLRDEIELLHSPEAQRLDPQKLADTLHFALIGLGNHLHTYGDQTNAAQLLTQAIELGQAHAVKFPDSKMAKENLASAHEQFGFVLRQEGNRALSLEHRQSALKLRQALVEQSPKNSRYRTYLGMSLLNLGVILAETGQQNSAREHYRQALAVHRQLAQDFPANPLHLENAAKTLNNLGNIANIEVDPIPRESYFQQAIEVHQLMCARFVDDKRQAVSLGGAICNLASHQMKTDAGLAVTTFNQAEEVLKKVETYLLNNPDLRSNLRNVYGGRASAHGMLYQPADAKRDWLLAAEYDSGRNRPFFEQQAAEADSKIAKINLFAAALRGDSEITDPAEMAEFATYCVAQQAYHQAVESYSEAFAKQSDLVSQFGDNAACAAIAAVDHERATQDVESNVASRKAIREQALRWLQQHLESIGPTTGQDRQRLRQWTTQPLLVGVREIDESSELDEAERSNWREFWSKVNDMLQN